jgi:tripartite-type tricarboxylate transporter receptor subunit TctC
MLMQATKLDFITVPYQGTQEALLDVVGDHIDLMCDQPTNTLPAIQSGQIRVLGVTSRSRLSILPNVPTLGESGLPGFELIVWHGLYAPKGTPRATVDRYTRALQQALADPQLKAKVSKLGAQAVDVRQATPGALRAKLISEADKWKPILETTGNPAK